MRKLIFTAILMSVLAAPALAGPELEFSTIQGNATWVVTRTGDSTYVMSFGQIEIDNVPNPGNFDPVFGDFVNLPTMDLVVTSIDAPATPGFILGTLTPQVPISPATNYLSIQSDESGNPVVWRATAGSGGMLQVGVGYLAYTAVNADLTHVSYGTGAYDAGYSAVIDAFGSGGYHQIDLSFSSASADALDALLRDTSPYVFGDPDNSHNIAIGGLDGAIHAIPAPGALLLGSMGMGIVGWLRRRRTL